MSELGRLTNMFFEPGRAFADIAERPRPWVPLALSVVMALVFMIAFSQRVGWERFARQTMESAPQVQNMPPEQRERAVAMQLKIMPVMGYVGAALGTPVMVLIVAGVLLLMFKVFMGAAITFKQMFGVTSYSFLPGVISGLAALVVMFLKNPDEFNLQNPTAFNLGAFFDPESTAKWKIALGTSIDLFTIWIILLLAMGVAAAARRMSFGKALAGVLTPWLLWVLLKAGFTALRG
jgi:hypothetical protein